MVRNSSRIGTNSECIYRIIQDGLRYFFPHMKKRVVKLSSTEQFKQIVMNHYINLDDLVDKNMLLQVDKLSPGCFVVAFEVPGTNHIEALTMHIF